MFDDDTPVESRNENRAEVRDQATAVSGEEEQQEPEEQEGREGREEEEHQHQHQQQQEEEDMLNRDDESGVKRANLDACAEVDVNSSVLSALEALEIRVDGEEESVWDEDGQADPTAPHKDDSPQSTREPNRRVVNPFAIADPYSRSVSIISSS